jgi:hypothetical protein
LADQFPNDTREGYSFLINFPNEDRTRFRVFGTPVAPGLTGGVDCSLDQAGHVGTGPTPGADAALRSAFASINMEAARVLAGLIGQMPDGFSQVSSTLSSHSTVGTVFKTLDANGNGKVNFSEILNADLGNSAGADQLLPYIEQQLALGSGGEVVANLPGVPLGPFTFPTNYAGPPPLPLQFANSRNSAQWKDSGGVSHLITSVGTAAVALPAVQLVGFCDGSVTQASTSPSGGGTVNLLNASSQVLLQRLDASLDPSGRTWWGTSSLLNGDGSALDGIVLGVFTLPSTQPPAGVAEPATPVLHCVLVVPGGTGLFSGIAGHGTAAINWGDSFNDRFSASFSVSPWIVK